MARKTKGAERKDIETRKRGSEHSAHKDVTLETPETVSPVQPADEPRAAEQKDTETAVKEADLKLAEMNERYIRLLAEYDNYRKRTIRDMENIVNYATEKVMLQLLPVLDDLDRATEHKNDKKTFEDYIKGIALIEDRLRKVLSSAGLEPIEAVGKPFDPHLHEAIMQVESKDHDSGIVTAEAEKGYMLAGKVIRYSKVIVSK